MNTEPILTLPLREYIQLLYKGRGSLTRHQYFAVITRNEAMRLKSITDHELICHVEPLESQDIQELLDLGIIREQQLLNEPSFWKVYSADAWKEEYKRFEERKARQEQARKRANIFIERKEFYIRKMMSTFPGLEQDYNNAKKILEDIVLKGHAPVYVQVLGCQDLMEMVAQFTQPTVQSQGKDS